MSTPQNTQGPSLYARILKPALRCLFRGLIGADELSPDQARRRLDALGALSLPLKDIQRSKVQDPYLEAEWLKSRKASLDCPVILYLHGGGYTAGSIKAHRDLASRLASLAQAHCLIINYRLAPEHPYPAALEDAVDAYLWLTQRVQIDASRVIIAGDSAGGGLALSTCIRLKQLGHSMPAGVHCMSPWTDLSLSSASLLSKQVQEVVLTNPQMLHNAANYYGASHDRCAPLMSPVYADLSGLPPLVIHTGTDEVLLDDSTRLHQQAVACGVDSELKLWTGMWHVWQSAAPFGLREAREALNEAAQFIRKLAIPKTTASSGAA